MVIKSVEDAPLKCILSTDRSSNWFFSFLTKKLCVVLVQFAFKRATSYQELCDHVEIKVKVPPVMRQPDTPSSPEV